MTMILSAPITVERRCATSMTLQRPAMFPTRSSKACWTFPSFSASRAEVASSNSKSDGRRSSARAMDSRCFCPPLRRTPPSPIMAR
mmetsp:Transcript_61023/g.176726  ORF Transcript_61023/g.176726 Transcript_61023/m.176726 type:complete len:86 (-) Transcript_61023:2377-2634(-)